MPALGVIAPRKRYTKVTSSDELGDKIGDEIDITQEEDVYYKVIIDRTNYSYIVYAYNGSLGTRKGIVTAPINFYERKQ